MRKTPPTEPQAPAKEDPRVKLYMPDPALKAALVALAAANKKKGKRLDTFSKLVNHAALLLARRPDNVILLRKAGHSTDALFK